MPRGTRAYLSALIKDLGVASVTPTSSYGVQRLMEAMDLERARVVVEYGPGTGVISRKLLQKMHPDSRLVLIERNRDFVDTLERTLDDPRVLICHGDAQDARAHLDAHGLDAADYVLSGIPFSLIPEEIRTGIVRQTHALLRPGGAFLAYQFLWQLNLYLHDPLRETFARLETDVELRNIPPLRIFVARKAASA